MPPVTRQNRKNIPFLWEGRDRRGNRVQGRVTASNRHAVWLDLQKQGIVPIKVKPETISLGQRKKPTANDIAVFFRQLSTMLAAGIPLVQSFEIIGAGHEKPTMQSLILDIKSQIESGLTLAEALGKHPLYFDKLAVNLVHAGEHSGALESLLDKIATYKEKTEAIKKKIKKALFYPVMVLAIAVIVTIILMVFVVPQFEELFKGFGAALPPFTQLLIDVSRFVQHNGLLLAASIGGSIWAFLYTLRRSRPMQEQMDRLVLKLPIVGPILTKAAIARYARTLATTFAAGVPLVEALNSVAGATGNIVYETAVLQMKDEVATGQRLQRAMNQTGLFPNMVVQMIAVGEESGSLDQMASKVADFYELEVDTAVDSMSSLLEPLIMAVLGVIIGGMVIAMYLPIFKLGSVV
jgi:type IV pilus assembly protein PilC